MAVSAPRRAAAAAAPPLPPRRLRLRLLQLLLLAGGLCGVAQAKERGAAAQSRLQRGNARFVERAADGELRDLRPHVNGQRPHTIVLSCSDSRVPVESIFEQTMGDLFVVRVAGQALDSSVLASIEYAIENLDVHLIVVLGHEGCGAIAAVVNTPAGASSGSAHLDALLADIRPRIASVAAPPGQATKSVLRESAMNALGVAADLPLRSPVVYARLAAEKLLVRAALYHLGSGRVEWLQPWLAPPASPAEVASAAAAAANYSRRAAAALLADGAAAEADAATAAAAAAAAAVEPSAVLEAPYFGLSTAEAQPIVVSEEDIAVMEEQRGEAGHL